MLIHASCPSCGRGQNAPKVEGGSIECVHCGKFFVPTHHGPAVALVDASEQSLPERVLASLQDVALKVLNSQQGQPLPVRIAFWVGAAALVIGVVSFLASPFARTANLSRGLSWVGLVLGVGAVAMGLRRDDYAFACPFVGLTASLLTVAVFAFSPGGPTRAGIVATGAARAGLDKAPPGKGNGGAAADKAQGPGQGGGANRRGRGPGGKAPPAQAPQ